MTPLAEDKKIRQALSIDPTIRSVVHFKTVPLTAVLTRFAYEREELLALRLPLWTCKVSLVLRPPIGLVHSRIVASVTGGDNHPYGQVLRRPATARRRAETTAAVREPATPPAEAGRRRSAAVGAEATEPPRLAPALGGMPWARIGEWVGQRNLSVTADSYTHVLGDETELDYRELLAA